MKNKVFICKERPEAQMHYLLSWFANAGVKRFDIHLSCKNENNPLHKYWITCHERIDIHAIKKLWKWLRYKNSKGADVYIRPHCHDHVPVLFLDDLNMKQSVSLASKYSSAVIQTSDDNTQVWVRTSSPLNREERKLAQSYLSDIGYTDSGSTSGDHLGRMCGMVSHKRNCWVNAKFFSTPRCYKPVLFRSAFHSRGRGARASCSQHKNTSISEKEFGWALGLLRSGMKHQDVYLKILDAALRRRKDNPQNYAKLTVENATKELLAH